MRSLAKKREHLRIFPLNLENVDNFCIHFCNFRISLSYVLFGCGLVTRICNIFERLIQGENEQESNYSNKIKYFVFFKVTPLSAVLISTQKNLRPKMASETKPVSSCMLINYDD